MKQSCLDGGHNLQFLQEAPSCSLSSRTIYSSSQLIQVLTHDTVLIILLTKLHTFIWLGHGQNHVTVQFFSKFQSAMLSSAPSNFAPSSTTGPISNFQPAFNAVPNQSFQTQQTFLSADPSHSLHQGTDPNSPELFKHNIQLVRENVVRLQELSRRASSAMLVILPSFKVVVDRFPSLFLSLSQHAYYPGNNPTETECKPAIQPILSTLCLITPASIHSFIHSLARPAIITSIKQTVQDIADIMRHSGVGALPLLPMPTSPDVPFVPPSEEQLMIDTNRSIQALYEKLKRSQESAAVVANLLGAPDHPLARGVKSGYSIRRGGGFFS